MAEVADAGEDHRDAALVGGRDHFGIAHAAARLDDRHGAVVRDDEVIAAADERGIAMVFTGVRHFRH